MSSPTKDVAQLLQQKPFLRGAMLQQCGGDWSRVVAFPDGSFVVYNNTERAIKARATSGGHARTVLPPSGPKRRAVKNAVEKKPVDRTRPTPLTLVQSPKVIKRVPPPLDPPAHAEPDHEVVIDLREVPKVRTIKPGVTVFQQPVVEREERRTWVPGSGLEFDWSAVELEPTCTQLAARYSKGYPESLGFWYYQEVLAMSGVDFDAVESVLRKPERVEIRPESYDKDKRYPVLGFHKGDVKIIVGFREPQRPMIIAAYFQSRTAGINPHSERLSTGSGGAKRDTGFPRTAAQLLKRLADRGAVLTPDPEGKTAKVVFHGQDLGKVEIMDSLQRNEVQLAWQRMTRKIHGIEQKESKVG